MKLAIDPPQRIDARIVLLLGGILLITFLSFFPALNNGFTNWDDNKYVLDNPYVLGLDPQHIVGWFTTRVVRVYVPLSLMTFALEHHFFGFDPFVYHLDNLLLHLGVTALVFLFLLQLRVPVWAAGFSTLIFGVHPMHVESVAWISERKDVLYAFFYMLALIFYTKYLSTGSWGKYWLSVVFGLFSILAKPMALSLPVILMLLDWLKGRTWSRNSFLDKIPFAVYIIGIALVTYLAFPKGTEGANVLPVVDIFGGVAIWMWTFSFYVQKFFFPYPLVPNYFLPEPIGFLQWPYLMSLAIFLLCLGILIRWRRDRWVVFCFAYFLGSIFFVLRYGSWVNYGMVAADRFIYLPCLGFCLLSGIACDALLRHLKAMGKTYIVIFYFVLALVIACLAGYTFRLTKIWNNSVGLWTYILDHNPQNAPRFLALRGNAYLEKNQIALAMADANRAVEIDPRFAKGLSLRGLIYHMVGQDRKALADLDRAILIDNRSARALVNRAAIHLDAGRADQAIRDCNAAIAVEPDNALAYGNRGKAYVLKGDLDAALKDFNRVLSLGAADYLTYYDRANIYFMKEDYDRALADLNQAIVLQSKDHISIDQRGSVYYLTGRLDLALQDYDRALSLNPDYARSYNNRGTLYLAREQYARAKDDYTKAIALDPNDGTAYYNRSLALQAQDEYAQALDDATKAQSLGYTVDTAYLQQLREKASQGLSGPIRKHEEK